jgi:hypothetical protein
VGNFLFEVFVDWASNNEMAYHREVILFLVWHDEDSLFPWALELSRGL